MRLSRIFKIWPFARHSVWLKLSFPNLKSEQIHIGVIVWKLYHVWRAWIASKCFRNSCSPCNRLFLFFFRNHAKVVTSQKWNKTSGGLFTRIIFPCVKRRLQTFALPHVWVNWLQLYYWSKYLFWGWFYGTLFIMEAPIIIEYKARFRTKTWYFYMWIDHRQ